MFNNIGRKIKLLAAIFTMLGMAGSVAGAVVLFIDGMVGAGIGVLLGGCLASWIGSFVLYGYGELIDNTKDILSCLQQQRRNAIPVRKAVPKIPVEDAAEADVADDERSKPEEGECPVCFAHNNSSAAFCHNCGNKLK